jgi:hypothetical protein
MILGTSMKRAKKILRNIPLRALPEYDEDIMIKEVSSLISGFFRPREILWIMLCGEQIKL